MIRSFEGDKAQTGGKGEAFRDSRGRIGPAFEKEQDGDNGGKDPSWLDLPIQRKQKSVIIFQNWR